MADVGEALRLALATRLTGIPAETLRISVERMIEEYRSGRPPATPILAGGIDVAAYAAYRMPATFAAVRAVLASIDLPTQPVSCLDVGGGTGAAGWAAVGAFPAIAKVTVIDGVPATLDFGADLALGAPTPVLRNAVRVVRSLPGTEPLPPADLVLVSYLLGELPTEHRPTLIDAAATAAGHTLVLVEPGTPAGYERMLAARVRLIGSGWTIIAPCPHQAGCPIPAGRDWCHFGVRINRSSLHRRIKDADLGYEDEKFSYLVATRNAAKPVPPDGGRVLRRPTQRKGMVALRLCTPAGRIDDRIVSKRHGADYRLARDMSWGDLYLPAPVTPGESPR